MVRRRSAMFITIQRTRALAILLMIDAMFVVLHLLTRVFTWDGDPIIKRHDFINLDAEVSFPTWWQQSQLLAGAVLCFVLGSAASPRRRQWRWLAGIFLYMSIDEGTQLHEGWIAPMQRLFDITDGPFSFAWVIPGSIAVLVFLGFYVRFWLGLPSRPRMWMGVAGVCYVGGALGVEMLGGLYKTERGLDRGYDAVIALEEGLESLGQSLFIFSLLCLIGMWQGDGVVTRVSDGLEPVSRHEAEGSVLEVLDGDRAD